MESMKTKYDLGHVRIVSVARALQRCLRDFVKHSSPEAIAVQMTGLIRAAGWDWRIELQSEIVLSHLWRRAQLKVHNIFRCKILNHLQFETAQLSTHLDGQPKLLALMQWFAYVSCCEPWGRASCSPHVQCV